MPVVDGDSVLFQADRVDGHQTKMKSCVNVGCAGVPHGKRLNLKTEASLQAAWWNLQLIQTLGEVAMFISFVRRAKGPKSCEFPVQAATYNRGVFFLFEKFLL